jgi:hypothetical protein
VRPYLCVEMWIMLFSGCERRECLKEMAAVKNAWWLRWRVLFRGAGGGRTRYLRLVRVCAGVTWGRCKRAAAGEQERALWQ